MQSLEQLPFTSKILGSISLSTYKLLMWTELLNALLKLSQRVFQCALYTVYLEQEYIYIYIYIYPTVTTETFIV